MIPFDFEYYKPESIKEAIDLFDKLKSIEKKPIYYGGGTEFISMARVQNVYADAVIDIKSIPECNIHGFNNNELIIGSAVTLTDIAELNYFPLLSLTVQRIADHTVQDKITLGGNLAGTIIYREAVLPLMVANSHIVIAGINGKKQIPLEKIFNKRIQISEDEIIIQVIIDKKFLSLPHIHVKRTKNEKIDYPLITTVALKDMEKTNFAFSGLCDYPFRSIKMEEILNDSSISKDKKIKKAINNIPEKILNDISGSSEYRKFMLHTILYEILTKFEEVN
ncbi:FAD binding domain-containing protein [Anaerosalibacter massiliensis]|uniref:FAD binding domain-containing protein n=1 Tax=Anaerosalibacter massiliensis TaxID=1347392 RepID=A0A9X2MIF1_9FIRM|nr:FAD binding domain-containing protein [Anaerosalibacter massiliensis]MCR2044111.1 FAD binding domain-containing protein [Anaerosalibacter massiliensis]